MAWNEFKANHLNKILREDLDREFEVDLKSHSDIYQPRKKWTIKAQVSQAHKMRLSKYTNVVTLSRTLLHSGKVRAVQFNTCPKICVATFFTEFGVDANSYITS